MKHATLPSHSRRQFLQNAGCGFGMLAFQSMLAAQTAAAAAPNPLAPHPGHHRARAKRIIFLFMQGGPSHVDMFDYKPRLQQSAGKPLPFSLPKNYEAPGIRNTRVLAPISGFQRCGQSGLHMTDMLPHLARVADELCVLRGMWADSEAHAPAIRQLHTGNTIQVRPSMGSWVVYGLGTENQNLPGFITICPSLGGDGGTPQLFSSAFLPAVYQGTPIGTQNDAKNARIGYLRDDSISGEGQRGELDFIQRLNQQYAQRGGSNAAMEGTAQSFELAFRMQMEAPGVLDISKEPDSTRSLYGIGEKETDDFGHQCLMARRLAEAGVRFIQITDGGWDHHGKIRQLLPGRCRAIDKPIAGLITDLKARGLLEDTLLLWAGEFGRTPFDQDLSQGKAPSDERGREHNPHGFTVWMAGGGVKPGLAYGETDEFGWEAVQGKIHIHDLHATMLHLLGLNHEALTYRYTGRDFRLTDVYGRVVKEILT